MSIGDHGCTTNLGFERRDAKILSRGEDERFSLRDQPGDVGAVLVPNEVDVVERHLLQGCGHGPVAYDYQTQPERVERLHYQVHALVRLEPAHSYVIFVLGR